MDYNDLSIGIITCGRPTKIQQCLDSIQSNLGDCVNVKVVDSNPSDETVKIYDNYPFVDPILFDSPLSPSAGRYVLSQNIHSCYMLFLDDDIILCQNTVAALYQKITQSDSTDIVSAAWREHSGYRELGQNFHFARSNNQDIIFKSFLDLGASLEKNIDSIKVDALHATMLLKTSIFEHVNFDREFGFYLELFDFFMQCKNNRISCEAITNTYFWHHPTQYKTTTKRQTIPQSQGIDLFKKKWNMIPVGPFGKPPTINSFRNKFKKFFHN